jgi:hypothetical protein
VGGAPAQELLSGSACAKAQALLRNPGETAGIEAYVSPIHPGVNYAFLFQGGYTVEIPLKQLAGAANVIRVLSLVAPEDGLREPACFLQTVPLAEVPAGLRGSLRFSGGYFLGEGKYRVDARVSDLSGRVYRKRLVLEAALKGRNRHLKLEVGPDVVRPLGLLAWKPLYPPRAAKPSRLTVLFHAASLFGSRIRMSAYDQVMLLSSLSTVLSESSFDEVRLIAFNLDQQREIFRQDHLDVDGFRKLLQTVLSLKLMQVPVTALETGQEHLAMLESMVREELSAKEPSDAILFLGPYARDESKWKTLPCESEGSGPPVFYFQHRIDKAYTYWRPGLRPPEFPDTLERLVHACSGEVYRIHDPAELADAIRKLNRKAGADRASHVQ